MLNPRKTTNIYTLEIYPLYGIVVLLEITECELVIVKLTLLQVECTMLFYRLCGQDCVLQVLPSEGDTRHQWSPQ